MRRWRGAIKNLMPGPPNAAHKPLQKLHNLLRYYQCQTLTNECITFQTVLYLPSLITNYDSFCIGIVIIIKSACSNVRLLDIGLPQRAPMFLSCLIIWGSIAILFFYAWQAAR